MYLEAPNGADATRERRVVAGRRIAVAEDIEEGGGVVRSHRALPPTVANGNSRVGIIVIRHLALEGLVLAALGGGPGIAGCSVGGGDNLGVAEQEQLVGRCRHGGILVGTAHVVRELLDALHLRLEIGGHEVPDLAGVHFLTEFGLLPTAGVGVDRVHGGPNARRGGEKR